MPNYRVNTRTNWFRVKNVDKFMTWLKRFGSQIYMQASMKKGKDTYFVLIGNCECGEFPFNTELDNDNEPQIDFMDHIAKHFLSNEDIMIVLESGAEKMNYIGGIAVAYNSRGLTTYITLDSIYELAQKEFPNQQIQELNLKRV